MIFFDILIIILKNIEILAIFLLGYSLCIVVFCLVYNIHIRKIPLIESLKKCSQFLCLAIKFYYEPALEFYDFNSIKKLFVKAFIPISQLNIFWVTKTQIKINANYKSNNGIFELKELILRKDKIEIIYDVISKNSKFNLVKGKNTNNNLVINNKKYPCNVDVEQKKIYVKYCGYYIFNNTKLSFHGKLRYDDSFEIDIDTSHIFNYEDQYTIKDLIDICNLLCQVCYLICYFSFLIIIFSHFKWTSSPVFILIDSMFFRIISSFTRRLFDVFSTTNYEK